MNQLDVVKDYLLSLQNRIVSELEHIDGGASFQEDSWTRDGGGGGCSRVLRNGGVFEQAGVNFSHVFGSELPPSATKTRPELAGQTFQAVGVSLVLHPHNPYVPTTHANFRFFTAVFEADNTVFLLGCGYEITQFYSLQEDFLECHSRSKAA